MSSHSSESPVGRGLLLVAALCFLAGAGITLADVAVRAIFNSHIDASIELTTLFIALGALLSMPVTYARRGHITAMLLSEFLPPLCGRVFSSLGAALSALFAGIMLVACSVKLVEKFGSPETTPDTGAPVYILLSIVVVTLVFAFLATLYALARSLWPAAIGKGADNG